MPENWFEYLKRLLGWEEEEFAPTARVTAPEPPPLSGEEVVRQLLRQAEETRKRTQYPSGGVMRPTEGLGIPIPREPLYPTEEAKEYPDIVSMQELTKGEKTLGEWMPWLALGAAPGISATAGWGALTRFGAKAAEPALMTRFGAQIPKSLLERVGRRGFEYTGKAVLAPLKGLEWGAGKLLGLPIKGIEKLAQRKFVKEAEKVAKSTAEIWDEMAVGTRTELAKQVGLKGTRGQATWAKLSGQEQDKLVGALTEVPAKPPVPVAEAVPEGKLPEAFIKATEADIVNMESQVERQRLVVEKARKAFEQAVPPEAKLKMPTTGKEELETLVDMDVVTPEIVKAATVLRDELKILVDLKNATAGIKEFLAKAKAYRVPAKPPVPVAEAVPEVAPKVAPEAPQFKEVSDVELTPQILKYRHGISDIEKIAFGKGTVKLYHGAPTEFAELLVTKGAAVPYKVEDVARRVAQAYGLTYKEFARYAYRRHEVVEGLSTATAPVASRWAQHFPQGEILSDLNSAARLLARAKEIKKPKETLITAYERLWEEGATLAKKQGIVSSRENIVDILGLPNKFALKSRTGALVELEVDISKLPGHLRKSAQLELDALKRGEISKKELIEYWNHQYKDFKLDPTAIKSSRIVVKDILQTLQPRVPMETFSDALALKATQATPQATKQATKGLDQAYKNLQTVTKPTEWLEKEAVRAGLPEGKLPQATIDNYSLRFLLAVDDAARSGVKLTDEQLTKLPPEIAEQVTAQMAKSLAATPQRPTVGYATEKFANLLKIGRKIRAEEYEPAKAEALRVATARAAAKAEKAPPTLAGQKAIEAQLARQVKAPVFEPPIERMTAEELAAMHQGIWQAPEMFYERLHASEAFWALAQGQIPQASRIAALEQFLGTAITKEAKAKLMSTSEKAVRAFVNAVGLPRAVQASYDLSAPFRQGFWLGFIAPKEWLAAWSPMMKAFVKEENALYLREVMKASPWIRTGVNSNLELTSLGLRRVGTFLAEREEPFMTEFAHLIPGVRMSERAYTTYLDWFRLNSFARFAQAQGYSPTSKVTPQLMDTAKLVNWMSGRGPKVGGRSMVPFLNQFFFSIRFQTSRAMMLANIPGVGFSFRHTPYVRKLYAKAMARGITATSTALAMLHYSGVAKVETDPRSTRFGKLKIGNIILDPWGGLQPYVRVLAQLATNQRKAATSGRIQDIGSSWWEGAKKTSWEYVKTKTAPVAGALLDIMEGETYLGEELGFESDILLEQGINRLAPFAMQDVVEAFAIEGGFGLLTAAPALVGFGIYTTPDDPYELQVPNLPEEMITPWQKVSRDDMKQPLAYGDLNVLQRSWVKEEARKQPDFEEPRLRLEGKFYASWREAREEMKEEYHTEALPYATSKAQGKITSEQFFDETGYIRDKFWGTQAVQTLFEKMLAKVDPALSKNFERWREEDVKPEDSAFDAYMEIYSNVPKDKDGVSDWEKWSKNRNIFLRSQPEWIQDYIETRLTQRFRDMPDPLGKLNLLYYDARKDLDGYYAQEQGKARAYYLYNNPIINAKLFVLGRIKTLHTDEAKGIVNKVLTNNGFNSSAWIQAEIEK